MDKATYIQTEYVEGNDIFIYTVRFPGSDIHEAVLPCFDGYTVYLDDRLSPNARKRAYRHALWHIQNCDFERDNVSEIELEAMREVM